ncbi:MAG: DMT family transporter [Bacteroidetes bacterium]|nr:MAG: DMT family transporter [Bacteroidota bacterium]
MLFLLLSILCSTLIGFLFKWFDRHGLQLFQVIMFNYFICVVCGVLQSGTLPYAPEQHGIRWMPYALILGLVFVIGFNAAALTVRYFGITVSQIMQKMSILLTVPFAILVYAESSGLWKLMGITFAMCSIILINWPAKTEKKNKSDRMGLWWIPLLAWILSGVIEIVFVLVNHSKMVASGDPIFITTGFFTAGLLGLVIALIGWITGRMQFNWSNLAGGIILGVPNYGSMYFLLQALDGGLEASLVFPLNNVAIILLSTLGAIWLFHERISRINWWGVIFSIVSILLISR